MRFRYGRQPHPHIFIEQIIDPEVYSALVFPDGKMAPGKHWGLTASDPEYGSVLEDPGWKLVHDTLRGEAFVMDVVRAFADDLRDAKCLIDPDKAHLAGFVETREQKEMRSLPFQRDPNELFTRMDFQSKGFGAYKEFVHLDWDRRMIGGILFFSDSAEEGLVGGETAIYRDRGFRNDRWCHDPELTAAFAPRHNTGIIFLNSNAGFHGPRAITALTGRRRWLYYTISSTQDVWPHEPRPALAAR
jgi:hypothetical protein